MELAASHPQHVAAAWCGHTEAVAEGHYWQVREEDFAKATGKSAGVANSSERDAPDDAAGNRTPSH